MRILLIHPNDHSGGAEIAGSGTGQRRCYLVGCPKAFLKSGFQRSDGAQHGLH